MESYRILPIAVLILVCSPTGETATTQTSDSGCYGPSGPTTMTLDCTTGFVVAIEQIWVGAKQLAFGCPLAFDLAISNDTSCCRPSSNPADDCIWAFDHSNFDSYHAACNGEQTCTVQVINVLTAVGSCSNTIYPATTTFAYIDYVCVEDPCTTNELLPRAEYRGGQCAYVTDKAVCDVYLNPNTWYRAEGLNGYQTMQETPADFLSCGTKFPIWMNGTHPTMSDGEVDRQGCQTDLYTFCNDPVTIKVKNCGAFYVYKMPRTGSCPEAYCFGGSDPCPPFDPCDYYENTAIPHDASRSTSCSVSEASTCDDIASDRWYKFAGQANYEYLTVATSCPTSTTCGTESQLWINGIAADYPNGTRSSYACVKRGDECCAKIFELQSKQCAAGFTVYHFNQDLAGQCHGFCTDDTSATCPVTPRPTVPEPPRHQDDDDDPVHVWLVPVLLVVLLAGCVLGTVVTYAVITIKRKEKVADKYLSQEPTDVVYEKNSAPVTTSLSIIKMG